MEHQRSRKWIFRGNEVLIESSAVSVRGYLNLLYDNLNKDSQMAVVPLGHGDPSAFPSFRTSPVAEDAILDTIKSAKFNGYTLSVGMHPARR